MKLHRVSKKFRGLTTSWLQNHQEDKPILMMLHGFPDSPLCWDLQTVYFQSQYQIVIPYYRGAWPSDPPSSRDRYSIPSIILDLMQILDCVDPSHKRSCFILCHDIGAAVAWEFAPFVRSRLRGMVVLNGLSVRQWFKKLTVSRQALKSWYITLLQVPKLMEWISLDHSQFLIDTAHDSGKLSLHARPKIEQVRGALMGTGMLYRSFAKYLFTRPRKLPQRIVCPVLGIFSQDDAFMMRPSYSDFNEIADDLTVRTVAGNHWVHRENADMVNELVEEFLALSNFKFQSHEESFTEHSIAG